MLALLLATSSAYVAPHATACGLMHASSACRVSTSAVMYEGFWEKKEFVERQAAGNKRQRTVRKAAPRTSAQAGSKGVATPARSFEAAFAPIFVPSREANRRPDLAKMNDIQEKTAAKTFEKRFAPLFVPSREANRRPDLKKLNEKR
jgi:hypothetical protein